MQEKNSLVIAFDGEAKCGKTTVINAVAAEAQHQADVYATGIDDLHTAGAINPSTYATLTTFLGVANFNRIITISAGNGYRAATLYVLSEERAGRRVTGFDDSDTAKLRALLAQDGILDTLQNDPEIAERVSQVAKFAGAQALCGAIFADAVRDAYYADGGSNLVIVDARDPVDILLRNKTVGDEPHQIHPANIMPVYIDTPTYDAATWKEGDFGDNLWTIMSRRHQDATRSDYPVRRPAHLIDDYRVYLAQFTDASRTTVAYPYHLRNGIDIELGHIQSFAGGLAIYAQDIALCRLATAPK